VLVLEDDFEIRHEDFHQRFSDMVRDVPPDWDMLYLGGRYADNPIARVNAHVIRFSRMLTTSSYGVTCQFARKMAPYIFGPAPIDVLYSGFTPRAKCYIFSPRLMVQYSSFSDLSHQNSTNEPCMIDPSYENRV
jgi:hypothetical protein